MYVCPECLGELNTSPDSLVCSSCARSFAIVDGIPMLSRDRSFYFGEVTREIMTGIVEDAEKTDWKSAITRYADPSPDPLILDYVTSPLRMGFGLLLPQFANGTVLDCGCGWGQFTAGLARRFERTYAMDLTLQRAKFTKLRATQENLRNVTVFCSGDTPHIPLPSESVDVVLLVGVLEWIPQSHPGNPRAVQVEFLREIRRIVRKRGCVVIAIENRVGAGYLVGVREDHTGLRFGSLLPRRVSDLYSRLVRGKPYRTYTYTAPGYRSLLREAGFEGVDVYGVRRNYTTPYLLARLSSKKMVSAMWNDSTRGKRIRNALLRPLLRHVPEAFGIVASRSATAPSPFVWEIARHVSEEHLGGKPLSVDKVFQAGATPTMHAHLSSDKARYILKLPLDPSIEEHICRGIRSIDRLSATAPGAKVLELIPRPIGTGRFHSQYYALERLIEGSDLYKPEAQKLAGKLLPQTLDLLSDLAQKSAKNHRPWRDVFADGSRRYADELLAAYRRRGLRFDQFEESVNRMVGWISDRDIPGPGFTCAAHGDFWQANILADLSRPRIVGVLDWDQFEEESLPLLDLYNYLIGRRWPEAATHFGKCLVDLAEDLRTGNRDGEIVSGFARQLGVPYRESVLPVLVCYWWKKAAYFLCSGAPHTSPFLEQIVREPLDYFRERVS